MKEYKIKRSFVTKNYKQFRSLVGNREVSDLRIKKIKESINKVGYIPTRIVVNENMEVIDGQGRLRVISELGLPVYVDIVEECRQMNINQSNWTLIDYIRSYAEDGNINYKYLDTALKRFKKLGIQTIVSAFISKTHGETTGGGPTRFIREGRFTCTEEDYNKACKMLEFAEPLKPIFKSAGGRTEIFMASLFFACRQPGCNWERLKEKIIDQQQLLLPAATTSHTLAQYDKMYNHRNRGKKMYFAHAYEKYVNEK